MGAWSQGSFDNDNARDWVECELLDHAEVVDEVAGPGVDDGGGGPGACCAEHDREGTEPIAEAFAAVLAADNYLEAPKASRGLAAAEVVATLVGKPAATLPEEVASWCAGKRPPKPDLVEKAQRVVRRILKDSELKDLWAEVEDWAKWQHEVEGLLGRLEDSGLKGVGLN
jgi:hypothetical protein